MKISKRWRIAGIVIFTLLCSGCEDAIQKKGVCHYHNKGMTTLSYYYDSKQTVNRIVVEYELKITKEELKGISDKQFKKIIESVFDQYDSENVSVEESYSKTKQIMKVKLIMNLDKFDDNERALYDIKEGIKKIQLENELKQLNFECE